MTHVRQEFTFGVVGTLRQSGHLLSMVGHHLETHLGLLERGDVRINGHGPHVLYPTLVDLKPASVGSMFHERPFGVAMLFQALRDPGFLTSYRLRDQTEFGGAADDPFEGHALFDVGYAGKDQLRVHLVADDQFVIQIVEAESFGDTLYGFDHSGAADTFRVRHYHHPTIHDGDHDRQNQNQGSRQGNHHSQHYGIQRHPSRQGATCRDEMHGSHSRIMHS